MSIASALHKVRVRDFPLVTYSLIALNALLYLAITRGDPINIQEHFGLIPIAPKLQSMFASSFLHRDLVHLAANMFFLWLFGRKVEQAIGAIEFLLLYVGGGFAASVMHVAIAAAFFPPEYAGQPAVGASGPIAAVLGVFVIRLSRHKFRVARFSVPALPFLFGWLLLQLVLGVLGLYHNSIRIFSTTLSLHEVGYWAHVGGFVFGMAVAQVTRMAVECEKDYLKNDARNGLLRGTLLEVVGKYEALLGYDTNDAFAHAELGRTWALLKDREEAERYYRLAAQLYLKKGLGDDALARYDEMRRFWPEASLDPDTQFRLACYLEQVGQYERAVDILDQTFLEHPDSPEAEMAMLKAGQIQLNRLDKPGLAAATLSRFIDQYPKSEWRRFAAETLAKAQERFEGETPPWHEDASGQRTES